MATNSQKNLTNIIAAAVKIKDLGDGADDLPLTYRANGPNVWKSLKMISQLADGVSKTATRMSK